MIPEKRVFLLLACLTGLVPARAAPGATTFSNEELIVIGGTGEDSDVDILAASIYPSTITVSGFGPNETVRKVTITLRGLQHDFPDDMDLLLVGPEDQSIIIVSDAFGEIWDSERPLTLVIDDDAGQPLPDENALETDGVYRPTNHEPEELDVFPLVDLEGRPAPHPEPSSAQRLSVFAGSRPNGEWRLFVVDDEAHDSGVMAGGWSLSITTDATPRRFRRGDSNGDDEVNLADILATLSALFQAGGAVACADAADADDNGALDLGDAIYTLNYLFRGGPNPPDPGPLACGSDVTDDTLSCSSATTCPPPCPGGQTLCNGVCVDLYWDSANCGECGNVCPPQSACAAGVCEGSP